MPILEMKRENKTKQQLIMELCDIEIKYKGLIQNVENSELKLRQKVKHLNCIYGIIKLIQNPNVTIKFILEGVIKNLRDTFRFSMIIGIEILFDNKKYLSNNFSKTPLSISEKMSILDKELKITMYYLNNKNILPEERQLLEEICKLLKAIFEFKLVWI